MEAGSLLERKIDEQQLEFEIQQLPPHLQELTRETIALGETLPEEVRKTINKKGSFVKMLALAFGAGLVGGVIGYIVGPHVKSATNDLMGYIIIGAGLGGALGSYLAPMNILGSLKYKKFKKDERYGPTLQKIEENSRIFHECIDNLC